MEVINAQKAIEYAEKQRKQDAVVADAQARAQELTFNFTFG